MAQDQDHDEIYKNFQDAVNMSAGALEKYLESDDSKRVGWKGEDGDSAGESVGHESGRHIVAILRKKKSELDEANFAHMKKVTGYVHRHLAQRPDGDISDTNWRYSLMNWGHDPLQEK